jgi:hypothetical protein
LVIRLADLREAAVQPAAKLVRIELLMVTAPAGDHDPRGSHAREPGQTDELPWHPHRRVAYGP